MAGTPTVASRIHSRLTSDLALTALLPGGIYTRPIKRGSLDDAGRLVPPGATPDAFDSVNPSSRPRPSAVVMDGDDNADPLGPGGSFHEFPWVYFYAPPHDSGKDTIATAWDQAYSRLHDWRFATANGTGAHVRVIGRLATRDDPDDSTRVVGGMRLQVTGLWRNA